MFVILKSAILAFTGAYMVVNVLSAIPLVAGIVGSVSHRAATPMGTGRRRISEGKLQRGYSLNLKSNLYPHPLPQSEFCTSLLERGFPWRR